MSGLRFTVLLALPLLVGACSMVERRSTPEPVREVEPPPVQVPVPPPLEPEPTVQTAPYRPPGVLAPAELPSEAPREGPSDAPTGRPIDAKPPAADYTAPAATLVAFAEQAQDRGDYGQAAASLERALRIEPRNAYLWNRLARLRFAQGQYGEAGDLAAKSNALAGSDRALKRDNWKMVAEARRAAGDIAGARAAEQQVRLFSR